jgi:hypothetical protein
MKTLSLAAAAAALIALGACKQETVVARNGDDMQAELAAAKKVELPPSVKSSKSYRCKDNSIVYIDLFEGDKMASIRDTKDGMPTMLKADEAGKPLIADGGFSVSGSGATLTVERPGKGSQACKA